MLASQIDPLLCFPKPPKKDEPLPQCSLEEEDGHDQGSHILRRLGESVLESRNAGENFAERNQDIAWRLDPH